MRRQRDLSLDDYGISKNAYRELKYFCLQYGEKKQQLGALRGLSAITYSGMPHGTGISNPAQDRAERADKLSKDIELIEQTAIEADSEIYQSLIVNITNDDMPYEYLSVPCGRNRFYDARRKFFFLLDKYKNR